MSLSPSERLHALAEWQRHRDPEAVLVAIASQYYGRWSSKTLSRDDIINLAREVCDAQGWKYSGSR